MLMHELGDFNGCVEVSLVTIIRVGIWMKLDKIVAST